MKINYRHIGSWFDESELLTHYQHLASQTSMFLPPGFSNHKREPPEGYEDYVCVDVLGEEFVWMNENFPREQYTWYLWFESIFLVTPEMATFLALRWK